MCHPTRQSAKGWTLPELNTTELYGCSSNCKVPNHTPDPQPIHTPDPYPFEKIEFICPDHGVKIHTLFVSHSHIIQEFWFWESCICLILALAGTNPLGLVSYSRGFTFGLQLNGTAEDISTCDGTDALITPSLAPRPVLFRST